METGPSHFVMRKLLRRRVTWMGTGTIESHYLYFVSCPGSTCQLVLGVVERADHLARPGEKKSWQAM